MCPELIPIKAKNNILENVDVKKLKRVKTGNV